MRWGLRIVAAVALVAFVGLAFSGAADPKPKYAIKDVMKKAMKGGLCGKVAKGEASDAEKKELVEMFTALSQNKPPQGEAGSWKQKTGALVAGAKAAQKGEEGAADKLKKAANCKACHDVHKGS